MYLLISLTILGTTLANSQSSSVVPTNDDLAAQYLLPGESFPTFYDVKLYLDPGNTEFFCGHVTMRIIVRYKTAQIVMHAMRINIEGIRVYRDGFDKDLFSSYDLATNDTLLLKIKLTRKINPHQALVIEVDYVARFSKSVHGIYFSTYYDEGTPVRLITSHFEPIYARSALPCYDEPGLKAVFRTTIYTPAENSVVLSNMPERTTALKKDVPGFAKHEFEDTPLMSTFLLACLVANFTYVSSHQNIYPPIYRIPLQVYTRPKIINTAQFAIEVGQRSMVALEEYTDFEYVIPKIDHVAVPDLVAEGMENWGLIIYRERTLLVQEGVTSTVYHHTSGMSISHEIAHQWFGNEVGPSSWTYLWLSEGFAYFFGFFVTDMVFPEWRMTDQYVLLALQNVMQDDAVLSVNPMTHPVYTPSQIVVSFNFLTYGKSGSVIRMMQHFLTPTVFRRGIMIYIRSNSRRATTPDDLYNALQQALDESEHSIPWAVSTVMTRWEHQGGFPVLTVRRTSPESNSIYIAQERFLKNSSASSNERWHVPLNWVLSSNVDFSDTRPQAWLDDSITAISYDIPNLAEAEWFIFNKQQTGYYRVNYDHSNWVALTEVLTESHDSIHVLNRAQLVDDVFNLATNDRLDYHHAFDLSLYLERETDYIPWGSVDSAWSYLDTVLRGTPAYNIFQEYILKLTTPLYEHLGFNAALNEQPLTPYLRDIILNYHCRYGNEHCINRASEILQEFRHSIYRRPDPDIEALVYCSGLRGGDADNFNFLWHRFEASTHSSEQQLLLNALGCTSNKELRLNYLNEVLDDNSPVRKQDKQFIVVSVINSNLEGMEVALDFIVENWPAIHARVAPSAGTIGIFNTFSKRLSTPAHLAKIDELVSAHQAILTAGEQAAITAIRENIGASIAWTNDKYPAVEAWLRKNYRNDTSVITSSILVVFSVVVALLDWVDQFISILQQFI